MKRLEGKYGIITGASRGLGRALAMRFARENAAGLVLVSRNADDLAGVTEQIRNESPQTRVLSISADLSRESELERMIAMTFHTFEGRLDFLVNNASALGPVPLPLLVDYPVEDFRFVLETNLVAPFLLIQKVLPAMIENGGSVINVTSDAGIHGYPNWGAYGISKFGLEGLSQTWSAELKGTGIRVNWVDPGNLNTEMHRNAEPEEDPLEWADPSEVTEVFVYLASDESRDTNGQRFQAQEEFWGCPELAKERVL
jgi:NAD(P)-dependent dehydrogenase (short-subunit alcohol dehydrogenase family)